MKYIIHETWPNGTEDSIVIKAEMIEELRKIAKNETEKRQWENCWSEEA